MTVVQGSLVGRQSDPTWSSHITLGDDEGSQVDVTVTVFWGFWLMILLAIAIWEKKVSKRSAATRSVLKWNKFGLAITFGLVYYTYSFISSILFAIQQRVTVAYYISDVLFTSTGNLADIWLLGISYTLKYECLLRPNDANRLLKRRILRFHYVICVILLALWLVHLCINIVYTAAFVQPGDAYRDLYYHANKAEEAFYAVFFLAALELLLGSIWALVKSRGRGQPLKADFLFISMVAVPTLARNLLYLTYNAIYLEFDDNATDRNAYLTQGTYIAQDFLSGLFDVIVFGTVVYVAMRLEEIRAAVSAHSPDPAQSHLTGYEADTEMQNDPFKDKLHTALDEEAANHEKNDMSPMAEVHADPLPVPEVHGYSGTHLGY